MYCKKCGIELPIDANFCSKCGTDSGISTKFKKSIVTRGQLGCLWIICLIFILFALGGLIEAGENEDNLMALICIVLIFIVFLSIVLYSFKWNNENSNYLKQMNKEKKLKLNNEKII
jgi:hypothetical protein